MLKASILKPVLAFAVIVSIGGCASMPVERRADAETAARPDITVSADGRSASMRIDVLTYNIEGLPWPARRNRSGKLQEIGRRIAASRAAGQGPDIIVFQEVFSKSAVRAVEATGYHSITAGPGAKSRQSRNEDGALPGTRKALKGEIGPNFTSSGLVIASDFMMEKKAYRPFAKGSCAGFDCLSNKGALMASIVIPGMPGRLDVFTTHMQSQGASKVPVERHAAAHFRQTSELSRFVADEGVYDAPVIIAGDFNKRNSDARYYNFKRDLPLDNVHRHCLERPTECEVRQQWRPDEWRRVQDLQFFASGKTVTVRPVIAEGMFDGGSSGPVLSDHVGFRVIYEVNWTVEPAR